MAVIVFPADIAGFSVNGLDPIAERHPVLLRRSSGGATRQNCLGAGFGRELAE
jgi:hypothetical protein